MKVVDYRVRRVGDMYACRVLAITPEHPDGKWLVMGKEPNAWDAIKEAVRSVDRINLIKERNAKLEKVFVA